MSRRLPTRRIAIFVHIVCAIVLCASHALALVCAAPGSSGPANISGVVNSYYPGLTSVSAGSMYIPVGSIDTSGGGSSTPIAAGDLLLVIQIQDADIDFSNSSFYGGNSPGQGYTFLNSAGAYEYVSATGPASGGAVPLSSGLLNSYHQSPATSSHGQRSFQVIRVPQYSNVVLAGTVIAPPWNGATGGVVAIDSAGNLNWNSTAIDVNGRGFRGGAAQRSNSNGTGDTLDSSDYVSRVGSGTLGLGGATGSVPNGTKGEGLAGTPIIVYVPTTPNNNNVSGTVTNTGGTDGISGGYPGGSFGRGAPGNAGGGGSDGRPAQNDENTGGGGGGSYGPGGTGGFGWTPDQPPGSQTGGFGGGAVPYSPTRLFFGGGGGSGSTNDGTSDNSGILTSGASGGGIVLVRAKSVTGSGSINANGANSNISATPPSGINGGIANDAAGGGGGGGSVLVLIDNGGLATGATINVNGGQGGNNAPGTANNCPHGPGGGGSGGYAVVSGSATINFNGGANGRSCSSPWTSDNYGSSTSPGGSTQVSLGPSDIPGVMASPECYPRITVAKSTTTPNVNQGGVVTYRIQATNQSGYGTALNLAIKDTLPANFSYAATTSVVLAGGASRTGGSDPSAGASPPVWGTFSVPGGSSVAITFTANVSASAPLAIYQNSASVTYDDPTATSAGQKATPGGSYAGGGTVLGSNYDGASSTNEDVTVRSPATFAKSFNPGSIAVNGSTVLTVTINNNAPIPLTGAGFTDNYPGGLVNAATPAATTTCTGGAVAATAGGTSFTMSGATIPASGSCIVQVTLTAPVAGPFTNSIPAGALTDDQNITSIAAGSGTLLARPTIVKAFSPVAVPQNSNSTLTFTIGNSNATPLTGIAFTDSYPSGLINASPLTTGGTCTGVTLSPTTVAGGSVFNVTSGTVPAGGCTIAVQVRSAGVGNYPNSASGVTATETPLAGLPSNTAALGVGLITVTKAFGSSPIAAGGSSLVTLTLANPTGIAQTNGSLTDTLTNMTLASTTIGGSCTGVTPTAPLSVGTTNLGFSGINIPAAGCTITYSVTSATTGTNPNITSGVATALLPTGPVSNTANLVVLQRPAIAKAYAPASIQAGATGTMVLTITNANSIPLTGISFTDSYNANVKNASPLSVGGTCTGVVTTATAGGSTFNVTAGSVPALSSCTITVDVTSNIAGAYPNITSGVSASETTALGLGTGSPSNSATLNVVVAPIVSNKAFAPTLIPQNGVSTMTVTLTNTNIIALTNVNFTDTLVNMAVAGSPTIGGSCGGTFATPALSAGATSLNLTVPSIGAGASCTVTVPITSNTSGANTNQTSGATAAECPVAGAPSPVATLNVLRPPQLAKDFAPGQITVGGTTTLRFTVTNLNAAPLNNVQFTDPLSNMTLAATGFSKTCSGAVSFSPALSVGGSSVNPTIATLAANESCTISVTVTSSVISPATGHVNSTSGATSTETPLAGAGASAALDVLGSATIAKSFTPATIAAGGTSVMTLTLTNPNALAMSNASFTDVFPTGMTTTNVAQSFTGGSPRGTCTGAIPNAKNTTSYDDSPNSSAIPKGVIAGINLPANASCTVMVDVTAAAAGSLTNTVSGVTTSQVPTAGPNASATLTVLARPTVTKSFSPSTIASGFTSTMTVTIGNTNSSAITLTSALTDTFPAGVSIATAGNSGTCPGVTATAGAGSFTMANGSSIPAGGCTIIVDVTSSTVGVATDTIAAGALQTTAGTNAVAASDTLTVVNTLSLTYTKTFSQAMVQAGPAAAPLNMVFTITNNTASNATRVRFSAADTMPTAGGSQMTLNSATNSCSITGASANNRCAYAGTFWTGTSGNIAIPNSAASTTSLNFTSSNGNNRLQINAGATCTITCPVTIAATTTGGTYSNTAATLTSNSGHTSATGDTATVIALKATTITNAFSPTTIGIGGVSTLTFTLTNNATSTVNYTGATFTDNLPANLVVAGNQTAGGSCTGAAGNSFTNGQNGTITFSGLTIPAGGSCSVTLNVTSSTAGSYSNAASGVTTTQTTTAGSGAASATLTVSGTTLTKVFSPSSAQVGTPTTIIFTITNGTGTPAQTGLAFTETLPATPGSLLVANPANIATTCGSGSVTAIAGTNSVALANGSLAAGQASCTVRADVVGSTAGSYTNGAANISGVSPGMTNSVSATLALNNNPVLTKAFGRSTLGINQTTTLVFTIDNSSNGSAVSGMAFTDTLPAGLQIANPSAPSSSCGGTIAYTATNGSQPFTASGMSVPANASCTVTLNVRGTTLGMKSNGAAQISALTNMNNGVTSQSIEVVQPTVTKSFGSASILSGATTTLIFTLDNGNGNPPQSGIAVGDTLPSGLKLSSTTPAVSYGSGCTGPATAAYATATRVLSGLTGIVMADGTANCTITVAGVSNQTGSAGLCPTANLTNLASSITTTYATNGASNQCLSVVQDIAVTKSFAAANIAPGGNTNMTVTIANPTAAAITLTSALIDTFPAGMTVNTAGNSGSCPGVTATAGDNSFTMASGASIPATTGCTIIVNVTGSTPGSLVNTIAAGAVQTSVGNNSSAASASLNVYTPPAVTKAFAPATVPVSAVSTLTLTLSNSNATAATLSAALTDTLPTSPANMVVATPSGLTGTCTLGSVTATAGSGIISYASGATIPVGGCTISVNVTAATPGSYANSIAAGALQTNRGTRTTAAGDTLTVTGQPQLTVIKSASPPNANPGQVVTYSATVQNTGSGAATIVELTDEVSPYVTWSLDAFGAGIPFSLSQGAVPSGLTLGTPQFSKDKGLNWNYVPISGGGGAAAGFDANVTNWKIRMNGTMDSGNASFTINYKVMVK